jgi:GTP-binding protein
MFEKVEFYRSYFKSKDIPAGSIPEVALCGRSNVGKSSFINSFFNRKNLAKVSSTPGKTRTLNYYNVSDRFFLVDLPGFGYAKASKAEQATWADLVNSYFLKSRNLKLAIHFIDARHKPSENDLLLMELISSIKLYSFIILTKIDKLKQSEIAALKKGILKELPGYEIGKNIFTYSSIKGTGKKEIQKALRDFLLNT